MIKSTVNLLVTDVKKKQPSNFSSKFIYTTYISFDESTVGHILTIVLIKCVKNILYNMRVVNL